MPTDQKDIAWRCPGGRKADIARKSAMGWKRTFAWRVNLSPLTGASEKPGNARNEARSGNEALPSTALYITPICLDPRAPITQTPSLSNFSYSRRTLRTGLRIPGARGPRVGQSARSPDRLQPAERNSSANSGAMKLHQSACAALPWRNSRPGLPTLPQVRSSIAEPSTAKVERSGSIASAAMNHSAAEGRSPSNRPNNE